MAESQNVYDLPMTIKWGDCDAAGISYYAKNFDWFTDGRMGYMAHFGFPYMETFHGSDISLVCLKTDCEYKKMLRPLEKVIVRTRLSHLSRSRLAFTYEVIKADGSVAGVGSTQHTYVDGQGQPFNIKKRHPELWRRLADLWARVKGDEPHDE